MWYLFSEHDLARSGQLGQSDISGFQTYSLLLCGHFNLRSQRDVEVLQVDTLCADGEGCSACVVSNIQQASVSTTEAS